MTTENEPCSFCDSPVRLRPVPGGETLGAPGPVDYKRVCTNPRCETNTGPKTLGGPFP